jgi:hypothetical protein
MNTKGEQMLKFLENPHQILLDVINELYPDINADIIFLDEESYSDFAPEDKESVACVNFPDNGGNPILAICMGVPYVETIELIAHEAAHVICGYTDDETVAHGEEWQSVFENINKAYCKKVEEIFSIETSKLEGRLLNGLTN